MIKYKSATVSIGSKLTSMGWPNQVIAHLRRYFKLSFTTISFYKVEPSKQSRELPRVHADRERIKDTRKFSASLNHTTSEPDSHLK